MEQKDTNPNSDSFGGLQSKNLETKEAKLLICPVCDKVFSSTSNLKQHRNIHKNSLTRQKYKCFVNNCNKSYLYICTLKKHIQSSHCEEYGTIQNDFYGNERNFQAIYNYILQNPKMYSFIKVKQQSLEIKNVSFREDTLEKNVKDEEKHLQNITQVNQFVSKIKEAVVLSQLSIYNHLACNLNIFLIINELMKMSGLKQQSCLENNLLNNEFILNDLIQNLYNSLRTCSASSTLN